jgi:hypothetical protein
MWIDDHAADRVAYFIARARIVVAVGGRAAREAARTSLMLRSCARMRRLRLVPSPAVAATRLVPFAF